jgi:hypothetical protein
MSGTASARPGSYTIALPEGWWRIDLRPDHAAKNIDALVAQQLAGLGEVPQLRRQLRTHLLDQAEAAYAAGGVELFLCRMPAPPATIPAALLITVPPPDPRASNLTSLASLLEGTAPSVHSHVTDLPAGTALRRHTRRHTSLESAIVMETTPRRPASPKDDSTVDAFGIDYYVPIPHTDDALLLLSFSSPLLPLEEALIELFDAAAQTLRWTA